MGTKSKKLSVYALIATMALAIVCFILSVFLPLGVTAGATAGDSLIYSLDFSDEANRGDNGADNSLADGVITGTGITYTENAVKGKTAVNFVSAGVRQNYVTLPADILNNDSLTMAGWFKIPTTLPSWSRLFSIYKDKDNRIEVMPYASNMYNGLSINFEVDNTTIMQSLADGTSRAGGDSFIYRGSDPRSYGNAVSGITINAQSKAPLSDYTLPVYDAWTHIAFEFTPSAFYYYQNGNLIATVLTEDLNTGSSLSLKQLYSTDTKFILGATLFDNTTDISASYADVRFYNKALSGEELKEEFDLTYTDFLTASYDFEDGVKDSVRGYEATLDGNASVGFNTAKDSNVLSLDGHIVKDGSNVTEQSVLVLPTRSIHGHNQLTISMDINVSSSTASYSRIFEFAPQTKQQALTIGANWGGKGTTRIKFTKWNDNSSYTDQVLDYSVPYGKWINLTLSLDGTTANLYVDGILGASTDFEYSNGIFWNQDNLYIGGTPYWGDTPLKGSIDNIKIYSTALSDYEVLTENGISAEEDDETAVNNAMAEITELPTLYFGGMLDLPSIGTDGVRISWASSNTVYVTDKGEFVSMPTEGATVKMTATFKRGDVVKTKTYTLDISSDYEPINKLLMADLHDVDFEEGSYYQELMVANLDFMMSLNKDKLLYNYRLIAGVDTKGATSYGNWIATERGGAGQFEAHYVIALAKASTSMPDYEYNGESVLDRLDYMVKALKECQDAYATHYPEEAGYLGAIHTNQYHEFINGKGYGSVLSTPIPNGSSINVKIWVPWYFNHKHLEAMLDVANYAATAELRALGKEMVIAHADWVYNTVKDYTTSQLSRLVGLEYGGMAEVMFQIYAMTGNENHLKAGQAFEEKSLLDNIYNNVDVLSTGSHAGVNGKHANTLIPKILACAAGYEVTHRQYYKTICINAFEMITARDYAFGGVGRGENFEHEPGCLETGWATCETCCSYNMLKLADYLFRWTGDSYYADYFEKTYTNHILSSMNPDTGLKTYFVSTAFGSYKIYHTKDQSFWCCSCTGMESFAKLTNGIYYLNENELTVNMFYPSTVKVSDSVSVVQSGNFYVDQKTEFTVKGSGQFTLRLRMPSWATAAYIKLNGEDYSCSVDSYGYYEITRTWADGDKVSYSLPFSFYTEDLNDSTTYTALMYGPLTLVADLGAYAMNQVVVNQTEYGFTYNGPVIDELTVMNNDFASNAKVTSDADGNIFVTLNTLNQGVLTFRPFNQVFTTRYGMYFKLNDASEFENKYYVNGNTDLNTFDFEEDLFGYTSFGEVEANEGALVVETEETAGVLTGLETNNPVMVETNIKLYGSKFGALNAGLIVGANGTALTNLNGYFVGIVKSATVSEGKLVIAKVVNGVLGEALVNVPVNYDVNNGLSLRVVYANGTIYVYLSPSSELLLSTEVDESFVTLNMTDVGLLASACKVSFDDFTVCSANASSTRALTAAVAHADTLTLTDYTTVSVSSFNTVLTKVKSEISAGGLTEDRAVELDAELRTAIKGLGIKGDVTALTAKITALKGYDLTKYVSNSVKDIPALIAKLDAIPDINDLSVAEVDALVAEIDSAVNGMVLKADLTELNEAIAVAESLNGDDYLSREWNELQEILKTAKGLGNNVSQSQADAVTTMLNNAIDALVEKPETEGGCNSAIDVYGGFAILCIILALGATAIFAKKLRRKIK